MTGGGKGIPAAARTRRGVGVGVMVKDRREQAGQHFDRSKPFKKHCSRQSGSAFIDPASGGRPPAGLIYRERLLERLGILGVRVRGSKAEAGKSQKGWLCGPITSSPARPSLWEFNRSARFYFAALPALIKFGPDRDLRKSKNYTIDTRRHRDGTQHWRRRQSIDRIIVSWAIGLRASV